MEHPSLEPLPPSAGLCRRCAAIDFDILLSKPSDGPVLGRIAQGQRGICSLCDFFFDLLQAEAKEGEQVFYSYRLRSGYYLYAWPVMDVIVLRLDPFPQGMQDVVDGPGIPYIIHRSQSTNVWLQPLGTSIDFEIPKRWLSMCTTKHPQTCVGETDDAISLKIIDCATRSIVQSDANQPYVTLSYVWGPTVAGEETNGPAVEDDIQRLPANLPKTIEDAIVVTKTLDYKYLWVDKYCIDQTDPEDALHQIRQMHLIYRNCVLTIIDAAGKDPHHGLPGVRPNSRSPNQPFCTCWPLRVSF